MTPVNWRRGLLRIWLTGQILWTSFVLFVWLADPRTHADMGFSLLMDFIVVPGAVVFASFKVLEWICKGFVSER
jgi:hypothetical protein